MKKIVYIDAANVVLSAKNIDLDLGIVYKEIYNENNKQKAPIKHVT